MSIKRIIAECAMLAAAASAGSSLYGGNDFMDGYNISKTHKSTLNAKQKKARKSKNKIASKSRSKNRRR